MVTSLPGNAAKWHEITHYLYALPLGWSMAMHGVNLKTWERLDPRGEGIAAQAVVLLLAD